MRPLLLNAESDGLFRATAQLAGINDNDPRGILHVLQRPLAKSAGYQLLNWISIWNPPEFIEAPSGTPAATLDSVLKRNIERCAINASLPTRDYFHPASRRRMPPVGTMSSRSTINI